MYFFYRTIELISEMIPVFLTKYYKYQICVYSIYLNIKYLQLHQLL